MIQRSCDCQDLGLDNTLIAPAQILLGWVTLEPGVASKFFTLNFFPKNRALERYC